MCRFFSFVTQGNGKMFYFNHEQRENLCKEKNYSPDSHTSICTHYELIEDKTNKYEYNPITKVLVDDQINAHTGSDRELVIKKLETFDFKTICPELIIKDIINPLYIERNHDVDEYEINLLKSWIKVGNSVGDFVGNSVCNSAWNSVRNSVRDSVWDSVWNSVGYSLWNSVGYSLWNSVWDSVWNSVRNSVRESIWDSIRESIWDSVGAYYSSFFNIKTWENFENLSEYENPFKSGIELWERGLVPSFDGKTWRLHSGIKLEIVYEMEI